MGNEATIDLKANPSSLDAGLAKGLQETQNFATDATQAFEKVEKASETLSESLVKVGEHLTNLAHSSTATAAAQETVVAATTQEVTATSSLIGLIKEQLVISGLLVGSKKVYTAVTSGAVTKTIAETTAFSSLNAVGAKVATTIGSIAASVGKSTALTVAATVAVQGLTSALDSTGQKMAVIDKALVHSQSLLDHARGDLGKLNSMLDELGVTAEEAGIKVETNLTRVQDAWSKAFKNFATPVETELAKAEGVWGQFWRDLQLGTEREAKPIADVFEGLGNFVSSFVKDARQEAKDFYMDMSGASQQQIADETARMAKLEQIARSSKINAINEKLASEGLARFQTYYNQRLQSAKQAITAEKAASEDSIISLERQTKAMDELRRSLELAGKFKGHVAEDWLAKDQAIINRTEQLKAAVRSIQRELSDDAGEKGTRSRKREKDEEKQAIAVETAGRGQLLAMLDDEKDKREKLAKFDSDNAERFAQQKEDNLNRIRTLEKRIHDQELADIAELNAKDLERINRQLAFKKQLKEEQNELGNAQVQLQQEKALQVMQLQGVTQKRLHEERMKFIDEEEQRLTSQLEVQSPEAQEDIKFQARKKRQQELAQFEHQQVEDAFHVQKLQEDEKQRQQFEALEKRGASEREFHELKMRFLEQEAREAQRIAQTDADKLEARLDANRKAREEEARFLQLKKDGVNVDQKAAAQKPMTRKQINAELKKAAVNRRAAVAAAQARKQLAKTRDAKLAKDAKDKAQGERRDKNKLAGAANRQKDIERQAAKAQQHHNQQNMTAFLDAFGIVKKDAKNDARENKNTNYFKTMTDTLKRVEIAMINAGLLK